MTDNCGLELELGQHQPIPLPVSYLWGKIRSRARHVKRPVGNNRGFISYGTAAFPLSYEAKYDGVSEFMIELFTHVSSMIYYSKLAVPMLYIVGI